MTAGTDFEVAGTNAAALFTLMVYRSEGMALLAMNWKAATPPPDFVGFAIEYQEPGGDRFFALNNRLSFPDAAGLTNPNTLSTRLSPIQKFRWVHFPPDAELPGDFQYRVTPVFMDGAGVLSYGEAQQIAIALSRQTYPTLNIAFTRGFVSSQAFVDRYEKFGPISELLPALAKDGLTFVPTHPKAAEALPWMGFEARRLILDTLDKAVADTTADVRVVAYDLDEPNVVAKLKAIGSRLKIIIDDSGAHKPTDSAESQAAAMLAEQPNAAQVKRQHVLNLQHNKFIVTAGNEQTVVCGSTNFSWRGFYVQSNNAVWMQGAQPVQAFEAAFDAYWSQPASQFGSTPSALKVQLGQVDAKPWLSFSPHAPANAQLAAVADDIRTNTGSSLLYSLAFLYQTTGPVRDAIKVVMAKPAIFVYGISDRAVGGLQVQTPDGNVAPVYPSELAQNVPPPFSTEPVGGGGIRMHHKFVVIDFDKPTARVHLGSYNFSSPADLENGENLLEIRDRRVAVAYMVEALRMFDHYQFRIAERNAKVAHQPLVLHRPPKLPGELPWWHGAYTDAIKIRDRLLFAG